MEIAIVQTAPGDAVAFLRALQPLLPDAFTGRAEIVEATPDRDARLPRLIARVADVEERDFAMVTEAVATLGTPGFEITAGGVPRPPLTAADFPDPERRPALPVDLPWLAPDLDSATEDDDLLKTVARIMEGTASGEAFPETRYAEEDDEKFSAYQAIVKKLGVEPMVDQGDTLTEEDIRKIKPPRRPHRKKVAWEHVLQHLEAEVRCFRFARYWFGDAGHLRNLYRDQLIFDHNFMDTVNDRFDLVPKSAQIVFFLDIAMNLMVSAGTNMGGVGKALSKMMGIIWAQTKAQQGDPDGKIKGKIGEIRIGVDTAFIESVKRVEAAYVKLCADWGNLRDFTGLVDSRALVWPKDASGLRTAHALGFHYETMRVLLAIKSRNETGSTGYTNNTWGIVSNSLKASKPTKRRWDAKNLRVYSASSKSCGGHYYEEIFIGTQLCPLPPSRPPPPCNKARPVPRTLGDKIFGTDTTDETNPGLGIPSSLLDDRAWRKDNGWALAPYF